MSVRHVGRQEAIKHRYQHLFGDFQAVKRIEDEKIKCQGESVKGGRGGTTSTTRSAHEAESDKRARRGLRSVWDSGSVPLQQAAILDPEVSVGSPVPITAQRPER